MAARNVDVKTLLATRADYRAALASLLLCAHAAAAAVPDMNPGSWEVTMQLESPESPVAMPPVTQTLCLTRQDVESGGATLAPGGLGQSAPCKPEQLEISEGSATWTLNCEGLSGQGRMSFSGDSYTGSADLTVGLAGESQRLRQTFSGRRLGDCQK